MASNGKCLKLPPWCVKVNYNGFCIECQEGYDINPNGKCLPPNCAQTDDYGVCTKCDNGYYLDTDKICKVYYPNCI